jgi:hypothetical protein
MLQAFVIMFYFIGRPLSVRKRRSYNAFFGHTGGTYGYKANIGFDPKRRRGVFVLSNCRNSGIVDALMGPLWDGLLPKPNNTISAGPEVYDRYISATFT